MMKTKNNGLAVLMVLCGGLIVGACAAKVEVRSFPELTYQHLQPIDLNVAAVESVITYQPGATSSHVEQLFPTPPANALLRWAEDRLSASGEGATARFTIIDASVLETSLALKDGLTGAFTKEQSERYDAVLEARLEIFDFGGKSRGFATAKTTRSVTVREDATVNDRDQAWFDLTEDLMTGINLELEKNISQYLGDWLR